MNNTFRSALLAGIAVGIAGWGYLFDNGGSAFHIGRDAINAYFSAYDGVFFDSNLSYAIDKEVLFGNANATILSAKDADGNRYQVTEDGRILGIKTGNKLEQIELTIYSDIKAVKVNLKAYTLIIDEASDLAYFNIKKDPVLTTTADGKYYIAHGYEFAEGDV